VIHKKLLPLLGLLFLLGCETPSSKQSLSVLCDNQKALLADPRNNWLMVLDTVPSVEAYLALRIRKLESMMDSLKRSGWRPQMDSAFESSPFMENTEKARWTYQHHRDQFYLPCYPYVLVDGVPVSTEPMRLPTGGYQRPEKAPFLISLASVDSAGAIDSVSAFLVRTWDHPEGFSIPGYQEPLRMFPNLILPFTADGQPIFRVACHGYLSAMETRAQGRYGKAVCDLGPEELDTLGKLYPLEISVMNRVLK
jgi:hypothetical protein